MSTPQRKKPDWSAQQYLKYNTERTRPVHDLISQVKPLITTPNPRIYDLGCGPGNSTAALLSAFPTAQITGIDSSPAMLATARSTVPSASFEHADLQTWEVPKDEEDGVDLLFSNAVFHWLRSTTRIPTIKKLLSSLRPGAVLAFQVPDNYHQPSHFLMRLTATMPGQPWSPAFADTNVGDLEDLARPDLDPIETVAEWYDALSPLAGVVDVWRTEYQHFLGDVGGIVEWVKGTGLQPFVNRIEGEGARKAFLAEYERKLGEVYGELGDGKVVLGYPRLFVVAVRR